MDPLSISAGAIALCQALTAISAGVRFIASLRNAPAEFLDLQNQLQSLQAYLTQLQHVLNALDVPTSSLPTLSLEPIQRILQHIEKDVSEIQDIVRQFEDRTKGRTDSQGRLQIPKLRWRREADKINRLRDRCAHHRAEIADFLRFHQPTQSLSQTIILLDIKDIVETRFSEMSQLVGQSIRDVHASVSCLSQDRDELVKAVNDISLGSSQENAATLVSAGETDLPTSMTAPVSVLTDFSSLGEKTGLPGAIAQWLLDPSQADNDASQGTLTVHSSIRQRCLDSCSCQCHRVTKAHMPDVLENVLGKLVLSYSGLPVWKALPCNHPGCTARAQASVDLTYMFPLWMPRLSFAISLAWRSGIRSLNMGVPRVISSQSEVFRAIDTNNIARLQSLFSSRKFSPSDVDTDGVNLVTYSLYAPSAWPAAKFILSLNPRISARDNFGHSAITLASYKKFAHGHRLGYEPMAVYQKIIEMGEEEAHSTVLHDIVTGKSTLTIDDALSLAPQYLNVRDNFGLTPLQRATLRGNIPAVQALLAWRPALEIADYDWRSPLQRAAEFGHARIAQMLVDAGSNLNATDCWGETPLHLCTAQPSTEILEILLATGAKILQNMEGRTAIFGPMFERFPNDKHVIKQYVEKLQAAGASIHDRDANGMDPLMVAVRKNHPVMFRAFRDLGLEVEDTCTLLEKRTIFHIAAMFADADMFAALREAEICSIDPGQCDESGSTALELITRRRELPAAELTEGQTPASAADVASFKVLIDQVLENFERVIEQESHAESEEEFHDCLSGPA